MIRDLEDQISRELAELAETVPTVPGLVERVALKGARARRRRALAVAPIVMVTTAVILTPVLLARPGDGGREPGSSTASLATPSTTSSPSEGVANLPIGSPLRVPYVEASTLHVGSRTIALPDTWAVIQVIVVGTGVVLDVTEVDTRFAVHVSASGEVRELARVSPPMAVSRDGTLLAGLARPPKTLAFVERREVRDLVLVDLASEAIVNRMPVKQPTLPERFVGESRDVVLVTTGYEGTAAVWYASTGRIGKMGRSLVEASPDGHLLLREADGRLSLIPNESSRPRWTSAVESGPRPTFSPDGSRIAVWSRGKIVVLSSTDGAVVSESPALADSPWSLVWEGGSHVLGFDPGSIDAVRVVRCEATTGACERVPVGPGQLALAERP